MRLGIFAKTFVRPTFEEALAAARTHGLGCVQFNLACAGLPTLPDWIDSTLARRIRDEVSRRGMELAAVSGTGNLIHPDQVRRGKCRANLEVLIRACGQMGAPIVTLCTGTRDREDMWRAHPDNQLPQAWHDLVEALERLLPVAQEAQVILGVEPEPANVVNSAARARKLLDELHSPNLKIIFDAANLLGACLKNAVPGPARDRPPMADMLGTQRAVLQEAVDFLGPDIVLAHAKDLARGSGPAQIPAGRGELDYDLYLSLLHDAGYRGPLILHGLQENEVDEAAAFVRTRLGRCSTGLRE